jgi:hypothetical protein
MASYAELDAYARSKGGRLPTEPELRAWLAHAEGDRSDWEGSNTGLKNWCVPSSVTSSKPLALNADMSVLALSHRHPVPAELSRDEGTGRVPGHNGGVWEFVSRILNPKSDCARGAQCLTLSSFPDVDAPRRPPRL